MKPINHKNLKPRNQATLKSIFQLRASPYTSAYRITPLHPTTPPPSTPLHTAHPQPSAVVITFSKHFGTLQTFEGACVFHWAFVESGPKLLRNKNRHVFVSGVCVCLTFDNPTRDTILSKQKLTRAVPSKYLKSNTFYAYFHSLLREFGNRACKYEDSIRRPLGATRL